MIVNKKNTETIYFLYIAIRFISSQQINCRIIFDPILMLMSENVDSFPGFPVHCCCVKFGKNNARGKNGRGISSSKLVLKSFLLAQIDNYY